MQRDRELEFSLWFYYLNDLFQNLGRVWLFHKCDTKTDKDNTLIQAFYINSYHSLRIFRANVLER